MVGAPEGTDILIAYAIASSMPYCVVGAQNEQICVIIIADAMTGVDVDCG
jgi:hypothetical protein